MRLHIKRILVTDEKETWKDKVEEFFSEVFFYNALSRNIRKIWRFICRVIRWLPVLWNQEEWDFEYIYDLLAMKMKELKKDMSKDTWHDQTGVQKGIKQIDICLARMDRWRNWPDYYDYPMEDIYSVPVDGGKFYQMHYYSEENEAQRMGAITFEQKNYDKFWKDFLAWHRGWWT